LDLKFIEVGTTFGARVSMMVATRDGLWDLAVGADPQFRGHEVARIARDGGTVWAVTDGTTIRRGPGDWETVAESDGFEIRCILPSTLGLLVGTSDGRLMRLAGDRFEPFESFDDAEGRDKWWQVGGLDSVANTRSLAQAPDGTIFLNIHVGGIYRSRDDGATWEPTIDQETDVHEVRARPDGLVVAATGTAGLCVSRDGGDTWDSITAGLPTSTGMQLPYARSVALDGDVALVTASNGPMSDEAGVYRVELGNGATLVRCARGLPARFRDNIDTGCLSAGDGIVTFGTTEGTVFASHDAGESWEQVMDGLPPVLCVLAA
jgi:hypothetical protein